MSEDFEKAFAHILKVEGGYVNDPNDPGGETKYGICKRSYPAEDIKNLSVDRAKLIYRIDYWNKIKGDELPYPINLFVFDAAVNQGVNAAITMLQKTLRIPQDGIIGVQTIKAAKNMKNDAIAFYMADRAMRYTGTRNFDKFGRGWFQRLFITSMEA